jgi:nicotinamide riboside transporter PnuC
VSENVPSEKPPRPPRPFRDSALLYAGMAIVFVVLVFITGGKMSVAIPVAFACFVIATGYAWWKLKQRLDEERRQREQEAS